MLSHRVQPEIAELFLGLEGRERVGFNGSAISIERVFIEDGQAHIVVCETGVPCVDGEPLKLHRDRLFQVQLWEVS